MNEYFLLKSVGGLKIIRIFICESNLIILYVINIREVFEIPMLNFIVSIIKTLKVRMTVILVNNKVGQNGTLINLGNINDVQIIIAC